MPASRYGSAPFCSPIVHYRSPNEHMPLMLFDMGLHRGLSARSRSPRAFVGKAGMGPVDADGAPFFSGPVDSCSGRQQRALGNWYSFHHLILSSQPSNDRTTCPVSLASSYHQIVVPSLDNLPRIINIISVQTAGRRFTGPCHHDFL